MVVAELATTRPFSWPIKPAWSVLAPVKRQGHPQELVLSVYREHGVIPKESREDNHNRTPENLDTYQLVEPGDVVFNKMKAWSGSVGVAEHRGIVSPDYMVCEVLTPDIDRRFLHYLLRSQALFSEYRRRSKGIRPSQWRLYFDELRSVELPIPDFATQRRIADMLDTETVRIDTLIEKNERVLELLSQRATALITAAVTGAVEVRQSGGPRTSRRGHWISRFVLTPLKYIVVDRISNGVGLPAVHENPDWPRYIRTTDIAGPRALRDDVWYSQPPELLKQASVQPGDLLLTNAGTVGKAYLHTSDESAVFAGYLTRVRPDPLKADSRFVAYCCESQPYWDQINTGATHSTIDNFSSGKYQDLRIPFPPLDAQRRIADMLDVEIEKMEELRSTVNRQQVLLRLRRQALITAAVSGQIEV